MPARSITCKYPLYRCLIKRVFSMSETCWLICMKYFDQRKIYFPMKRMVRIYIRALIFFPFPVRAFMTV